MNRILLGANYYPEDWDASLIDFDIEKMKECGFNIVRIAEFSWKKMEPSEGDYSFDWLHRVVDKMKEAGIGVIMGTPTATPPSWLLKKYPDMVTVSSSGVKTSHGGRRHCCSSNPDYQRESARIVERLAREFAFDKGVIGWQIDNEIYHFGDGCCCDLCKAEFHKHLYEKYGSVEAINREWNLNLFSQAYDKVEDIPIPVNAWHNPHIKLEWHISQQKNHVNFVHMQEKILRKYTSAPIGTDTMPVNGIDYRELNAPLDVAQFNHYSTDLESVAMWMDYMRKFSKIPFWNTETQPCWNGSTMPGHSLQGEGFIYMNTWLPIMLGGEANLYWLWRTHWAGHELMHGAVIDTSGRYTYANGEIKKASAEFARVSDFLPSYRVEADTALLFTSLNWNIKLSQDINASIRDTSGYVYHFYRALLSSGIHPDVIDAEEPLDSYKLIFTPSAYTLEENSLGERLSDWVKTGGVWVAGPLCDIRNAVGAKYKNSPYGHIESLTNSHLSYILPDDNGSITLENDLSEEVHGRGIYELFDPDASEGILTVKSGHSALIGKRASFIKKVGKGFVVMLGTLPEDGELSRIIKKAALLSDVTVNDTDNGIMVTKRVCGEETLYIVASVGGKAGEYRFDGELTDILEGKTYKGSLSLLPYELKILK